MARHRGTGVAAIEYPTGMNQAGDPSQVWIKLKPDGRVDVFTGTCDLGQGSRTVHVQIAADTIGVPYEWVTLDNSNTDSSPLCTGTFASRGTFVGGNAVRRAAVKAREALLAVASEMLEVDPADLAVEDGYVCPAGVPAKRLSVSEVAHAATWTYGRMITGEAAYMKPFSAPDPDTGECEPHYALSYGVCVAEVDVDDETGEVTVTRLIQVYDVGRAINPALVAGQIHGGAMMGLGLALLEESYPAYPSVEHRGGEFGSYLVPSPIELPAMNDRVLENPSDEGPFGAKAIGEMAANAQPPAIVNAIHDAVGIWITELPAKPERVLHALRERIQPSRRGKRVIFDEALSVRAVSSHRGEGWLLVDEGLSDSDERRR
jgi:CO/xanthine dehydrogenase Mo-binding subunit